MSEQLAHYIFLPWFRRGLSAGADLAPSDNPLRAGFTANLKLVNQSSADIPNTPIPQSIQLYGPGDITGIDHRVIIRTEPKKNVGDFEPNYFPYIEFSEPDFPWRYTPASPTGDKTRLAPWICLIVLKAPGQGNDEYTPGTYDPASPLPSIKVEAWYLPKLAQSWAWAHVQITTDRNTATEADVQSLLQSAPERLVSRLLCPRLLDPGTLYHAFVVPTFEAGRLAGFGQEFPEDLSASVPAWDYSTEQEISLPYYYQWEFRTGLRGDFEYLVRLLQPRQMDSRVGMRNMDCSGPGYDVPAVTVPEQAQGQEHQLGLEGALKTIDSLSTAWPGTTTDNVQPELSELLNMPEQQRQTQPAAPPLIVPPIYGSWHRARQTVAPGQYETQWLDTVNLDPRHRTTAGFGTRVVQDQQENLMAAAWQQIGEVEAANDLLRQAQLGRAASERVQKKHIRSLPAGKLFRLTAPLHRRLLVKTAAPDGTTENVTLSHKISESPIPAAALDPAFRRIKRPSGPIVKRQERDSDPNRRDIIERLNDGEVAAAGPAPKPGGSSGISDVSEQFRPRWARGWFWKFLRNLPTILVILVIFVLAIYLLMRLQHMPIPPYFNYVAIVQGLFAVAAYLLRRYTAAGNVADNINEQNLTADYVDDARPPDDFAAVTGIDPGEFKEFAEAVQDFLNSAPEPGPEPKPIDVNQTRDVVIVATDPRTTIPARVRELLVLEPNELPPREDELQPIMAAPEFDRPMYEALRDLSQDLLLPGLEYVPQNTLGLLLTNPKFVEAYMVGLNHEMGRELLWREYPTDQRGSYFRQFWDVRGFVPPQGTTDDKAFRESLKDIKCIHEWRTNKLGNNSNRFASGNAEKLVLLVRGDLLKKYPSTVIYAARAKWEQEGTVYVRRPILDHGDATTKWPLFSGTLPPDITFLGFDLTPEAARGGEAKTTTDPNTVDPGWFFVIEERVSETRFGMDAYRDGDPLPESPAPPTWDDLSWAHIKKANALGASNYCDVTKAKEATENPDNMTWNSHAAQISWITMQKPVRIAVHADDMIPAPQSTTQ
jgi:hypothetical protein